jgi:hypothetical protein
VKKGRFRIRVRVMTWVEVEAPASILDSMLELWVDP